MFGVRGETGKVSVVYKNKFESYFKQVKQNLRCADK